MSDSIYTLVNKSKYDNKNAQNELNRRLNDYTDTGLCGFQGEKIVFNYTDEINQYIRFIDTHIDNVQKSDMKEIILLDSYSSATIEGARTTVENIRKALKAEKKSKSERMVINTIHGNQYAIENGIGKDNIRHIWEIIVQDVCENIGVRGDLYRCGDVVVASAMDIIHTPCKYEKISQYMDILYRYPYDNLLIDVCVMHFYFVYIHPFCDGNGRLARIWLYSDLIRRYHENFKYISVSNEILSSVDRYYGTLKESEYIYANQINITTFIEYILYCICNVVRKGMTNHVEFDDVDRYIIDKINRDGITVSKLANKTYSEQDIRKSLDKLVKADILYRVREQQNYRYYKTTMMLWRRKRHYRKN